MQLKCPYCEFGMSLKTIKPGKFKPSCKKCKRSFLLMISEDGKRAKIQKLLEKSGNSGVAKPSEKPSLVKSDSERQAASDVNEATTEAGLSDPVAVKATPKADSKQDVPPAPSSQNESTAAESDFEQTMASAAPAANPQSGIHTDSTEAFAESDRDAFEQTIAGELEKTIDPAADQAIHQHSSPNDGTEPDATPSKIGRHEAPTKPGSEPAKQSSDSVSTAAESGQTIQSAPDAPTESEYEQTMDSTPSAANEPEYEQTMDSVADATGVGAHSAPVKRPNKADATIADEGARSANDSDFDFEQTMDSDAGVKTPVKATASATVADGTRKPAPKPAAAASDAHEQTMESRAERKTMAGNQPSGPQIAMPKSLGGYNMIKELGRGAMGAVYLAKQMSLNRLVALKTMQAKWLANPIMLARFTREAYAAAQLTHHNVVQVYDLGKDRGTTFFSMEFVKGQSLAELVKEKGKLEPNQAASYALQAARGLRFAHSQGMVHRDIKPGNLMLNEEEVVKVADLGLVKVPMGDDKLDAADVDFEDSEAMAKSAELTMAGFALGTAAYMAPEQAESSKHVDHRADIYALGCSLYVLLTGKPPFRGATAIEVITKHKKEKMVRPDAVVEGLPSEIADIVMKMVAKNPDDRYQDMDAVIDALETFLGLSGEAEFKPTEEHANELRTCVELFNREKTAKLRSLILSGVAAVSILFGLVTMFFSVKIGLGLLALAPITFVLYFVLNGIREQSVLFNKAWQFVSAARIIDWIAWGVGALVALAVFIFVCGPIVGVVILLLAAGIAAGVHFLFDRTIRSYRQISVMKANELFRKLRLNGVEEADLREFVARYSGNQWEEFFEELFGYDEKLEARKLLKEQKLDRGHKKFKPWRDKLIVRLEERIDQRRQSQQKGLLQEVEAAGLEAQGVSAADAKAQAEMLAESIVSDAEAQRDAIIKQAHERAALVDPVAAAQAKRDRIKAMLAEARSGATPKPPGLFERLDGPLNMFAGATIRFLLGAILLGGSIFWLNQQDSLKLERFTELWNSIQSTADDVTDKVIAETKAGETATGESTTGDTNAADVKTKSTVTTSAATRAILPSLTVALAGLVLVMSSFFSGWKMSVFVVPGVLIMIFAAGFATGILGNPLLGYGASIAAGLMVAFMGYLFGQTHDFD